MTWLNIVLALILFVCIIYVLVLAIDLRKTLKRAAWILEDVDENIRDSLLTATSLVESRAIVMKELIGDSCKDMGHLIRNLETLNNECNATLIRAKELVHEDIFDSTEDDLK